MLMSLQPETIHPYTKATKREVTEEEGREGIRTREERGREGRNQLVLRARSTTTRLCPWDWKEGRVRWNDLHTWMAWMCTLRKQSKHEQTGATKGEERVSKPFPWLQNGARGQFIAYISTTQQREAPSGRGRLEGRGMSSGESEERRLSKGDIREGTQVVVDGETM
jgi:hypothetical protein